MTRYAACSLVALFAAGLGALAAPPDLVIPAEVKPAGGYARFTPKTNGVSVTYVGLSGVDAFPSDELKDARRFLLPTSGLKAGRYKFAAVAAGKTGEQTRQDFEVVVGDAPPVPPGPGPTPPGPQPPPEPPAPPEPVKSFRAILVFESGDNLTTAQRAVLYGKAVEDWLTANCTDGVKGWRRRDRDAPGETDPTMAALWTAVKAGLTTTPCVALERNGKVTLVNLEATPAAMVEVFKRYRAEGK